MRLALALAYQAGLKEIPIGAVAVHQDEVISWLPMRKSSEPMLPPMPKF